MNYRKMSIEKKKEALENAIKFYNFPKNIFVEVSDRRMGQKFALASKTESSLSIHSNYMTYEEFNAFLYGYKFAIEKNLPSAKINA